MSASDHALQSDDGGTVSRRGLLVSSLAAVAVAVVGNQVGLPSTASAANGPAWSFPLTGRPWVPAGGNYWPAIWGPNPERNGKRHNGIDLTGSGAGRGDPILAAAAGTVTTSTSHWSFGNYVIIDHGSGWSSLYAHMNASPAVSQGQWVSRGQYIGPVGKTGEATGYHLHIEIHGPGGDGGYHNPWPLISGLGPYEAPAPTNEEDDDMPKIIYRQDTQTVYMIGEGGISHLVNTRANEMLNYIGIPGSRWVNQLGKDDFRQVVESFGFDYGQVAALGAGQRLRADGQVVNAGGAAWPPQWS